MEVCESGASSRADDPEILQGDVSISRFRDVKPGHLLEREVVELDDGN